MRFKLLPNAPASLAAVERAQRAVPLVPDSEEDCCARLSNRLDLPSRDVARTWLTFLRALKLAEETPSGFRRIRVDPTPDALREAFVARVFAADEVLTVLRDTEGPVDADAVFERVEPLVPQWEHHKNPSRWQSIWRDRTETILDWAVLLSLAHRTDEGYVAE